MAENRNKPYMIFARLNKKQKSLGISSYSQGIYNNKLKNLKDRIHKSYRDNHSSISPESMWSVIFEKNKAIHNSILSGKDIDDILDDPASTDMCYGFDNIRSSFIDEHVNKTFSEQDAFAAPILGLIAGLANAIGAKRVWFPESGQPKPADEPEASLDAISRHIGWEIDFPNPFPDEFGLKTSRGIASYHSIYALYQAWRIKVLSSRYGDRVLEIGAGYGRTAYYANRLGVKNYTIIDLPFTNISQANFLGRVLGEDLVCLDGETARDEAVKIFSTSRFEEIQSDVALNVDSITEMGSSNALKYADGISRQCKVFWSINHEFNDVVVHTLKPLTRHLVSRCPYWLRGGYVEELFLFP